MLEVLESISVIINIFLILKKSFYKYGGESWSLGLIVMW